MSERLLRHRLESVHGVRSAVHVRGSHVWRVSVYTLDHSQREPDIARRFDGLGIVTSCTLLTAGDPGFRKFVVVLVVKDLGEAAPSEGAVAPEIPRDAPACQFRLPYNARRCNRPESEHCTMSADEPHEEEPLRRQPGARERELLGIPDDVQFYSPKTRCKKAHHPFHRGKPCHLREATP